MVVAVAEKKLSLSLFLKKEYMVQLERTARSRLPPFLQRTAPILELFHTNLASAHRRRPIFLRSTFRNHCTLN